ncbi:MAG: bifunctional phosphoribosylaminoimidazolecarboxamide formyltransferase/IMP cyclohydrolase [Bdellovibrio sp.]
MFRRALVSVSDKTGLCEFLRFFPEMEIVSTGGTARFLREQGFTITDVSTLTGFPEVLGGRVKTLHPKVHMGLLARAEDENVLQSFDCARFDLVVVNLYPFAQALRDGKTGDELIEQIDVGGPSMLRAAAKNFSQVCVLCDPQDYSHVKSGEVSLSRRQGLAAKVFRHLSWYDARIAEALFPSDPSGEGSTPGVLRPLRYGENPHQRSDWWIREELGWHRAILLQGKELSFNNLRDLQASVDTLRLFSEASAVFVKHGNPCSVASHSNPLTCLRLALQGDPVSIFGGVGSFGFSIGVEEAQLLANVFLECLVAPRFSDEAQKVLAAKKILRLLQWSELWQSCRESESFEIDGGLLLQEKDRVFSKTQDWIFPSGPVPHSILKDLVFAEKVVSQLKSNAIAVVSEQSTCGLGMGQVSRIDAVEQAIQRWKKHHPSVRTPVLASDAFFPFADSIDKIADAGICWVLQPGGSLRDSEVLARAQERGVNVVLSQVRHFKH